MKKIALLLIMIICLSLCACNSDNSACPCVSGNCPCAKSLVDTSTTSSETKPMINDEYVGEWKGNLECGFYDYSPVRYEYQTSVLEFKADGSGFSSIEFSEGNIEYEYFWEYNYEKKRIKITNCETNMGNYVEILQQDDKTVLKLGQVTYCRAEDFVKTPNRTESY